MSEGKEIVVGPWGGNGGNNWDEARVWPLHRLDTSGVRQEWKASSG